MATGDDDADRFRVPRWISDDDSDDGELAERPPTTQDEPRYTRSHPYDGDEAFIPRAETPSLSVGEPLWPSAPSSPPLGPAGLPPAGTSAFPPPAGTAAFPPPAGTAAFPPSAGTAALPPPVTRGQREAAEPQRRGLIIVAVAAAVVVIVTAGLLIRGVSGNDRKASGVAGVDNNTKAAAPPVPAQPSPKPEPTQGPTTVPTTAGPTHDNAFGPLTIEAENPANTLTGSAHIVGYPNASGGRIVRNIGDWQLDRGPGTLRFNNIDVPRSGNYTLTFSYVDIDNEANRTAVIDISGRKGLVITVNGNDTCCRTQTVQVPLRKGKNTVSFGNLTSHAPSIDKIVITAP
jgi:hypothetical protein